jgi:hypothetical protein
VAVSGVGLRRQRVAVVTKYGHNRLHLSESRALIN